MISVLLSVVLSLLVLSPVTIHGYTTEDVYVNNECTTPAKFGDHVLLEYSIQLANGSAGSILKRPSQLFHTILKEEVSFNDNVI